MKAKIIDSFKGGKSDYEDKGIAGAFKYAAGADIRKDVDSLSCQQGLVEETGVSFDSIANAYVPSKDGNLYAFLRNGKVLKRTAGTWSLVYTDPDGAILGAEEFYDGSVSKTFMYWATATKLNRKEMPGASNWSDVNAGSWQKTNLTSSTWHWMKIAVGALLIGNYNFLAFIGYDGSYNNEALNLIPGNEVMSLVERNRQVIVGTKSTMDLQQSALFTWDGGISSNWIDKKILPIKGMNAMIDTDLPLFQAGDDGALYYSDMVNSVQIGSFYNGGKVNPGGVANMDGLALFGVYGNGTGNTGIYTYGRKKKNAPVVINLDYPFDCDEIGAVTVFGGVPIFSYKIGATYGMKAVDLSNKAVATYQSLDLKAEINYQLPPIWKAIKLETAALPAQCSIACYYRIEKKGSFIQSKMMGDVATFTTVGGQEAVFLMGEKGNVSEVKLILTPHGNVGPEVYKILPFYEDQNANANPNVHKK